MWDPSPPLHSARAPPFLGDTQREKRKVNERRGCKVKSLLVSCASAERSALQRRGFPVDLPPPPGPPLSAR